jgi:hypothetical protein
MSELTRMRWEGESQEKNLRKNTLSLLYIMLYGRGINELIEKPVFFFFFSVL